MDLLNSISGALSSGATNASSSGSSFDYNKLLNTGVGFLGQITGGGAKPNNPNNTTATPVNQPPIYNLNFTQPETVATPQNLSNNNNDNNKTVTGSLTVTDAQPQKSNTALYVGIGAGALVLIAVLFFMFKKK